MLVCRAMRMARWNLGVEDIVRAHHAIAPREGVDRLRRFLKLWWEYL